jgi:hypothetical protein
MLAYGAAAGTVEAAPPREISLGVRRLARLYVWITIASSAIVFSEPALYDVLLVGAALMLPVSLAWSPSAAGLPFISCYGPPSSLAVSPRRKPAFSASRRLCIQGTIRKTP